MRHDYAIYAFTGPGAALARKIAGHNGGRVFLSAALQQRESTLPAAGTANSNAETVYFQRFSSCLAENWFQYSCQVLICASGIALRALAPLLHGKHLDPAVLLPDQAGRFVISLLGGHLAEANRLAEELAGQIGATPVITTATDTAGLPAIDLMAKAANLRLGNLKVARAVNAAWLRGEKVFLYDPLNRLGISEDQRAAFFLPLNAPGAPSPSKAHTCAAIVVEETNVANGRLAEQCGDNGNILYLKDKELWLGLGCRRGVDAGELRRFARRELAAAGYHPRDLAGLASLNLKQDEAAVLDLAAAWNLPLRFFSSAQLNAVSTPNPSQRVKQATGTASVCEAAVLLAASANGQPAALLLPKRKTTNMTLALAGPGDYKPQNSGEE